MVACSWDRQLLASSCMPLIEKGVGHEAYTMIVRNSLFECNEEFRFTTLLLVSNVLWQLYENTLYLPSYPIY